MKYYYKQVVFLGTLIILLGIVSNAEPWHCITPLKSTRADVERILGKANEHGYYQLEEGKVRMSYGAGIKTSDDCWGRASRDVVTEISIDIEYPLNMKDLKTDIRKFKKTIDSHHPSNVQYADWEKGIAYDVNADDNEVYDIYYWPSGKDCDEMLGKQ